MKKIFTFISMSILAAPLLFAAEEKPTPVAPKNDKPAQQASPVQTSPAPAAEENKKPADEQPATTIVLKNKSSFGVDPVTRSPFWPISWKPTGKIASGGTDEGAVPPGAFLVTSITLDGATRFAIINGKTMSEGQQFGLQVGTRVYHVTVKRIEDGRVILGRQDEEIVVPLRRK